MEIKLFGAAKTVTGSCYSLTSNKDKILVDCGMFQGGKDRVKLNYAEFSFAPKHYKALLLSHAHLDHCGRIPKLLKEGFKGKIYSTAATKDLAFIVLMDSAKIAAHDTEYENKRRIKEGLPKREPIYTEKDVRAAMSLFQVINYNRPVKISRNITATFYDAGHILGAASIMLEMCEGAKNTTIVFSGDLGQTGNPIVRDPETITKADYLFIESTYGDRLHVQVKERKNKFLEVIRATYKKGGKLLIPSFAIERSQELLYDINEFVEKNLMPPINIYLDSPMAIKSTEVFKKHPECYDQEIKALLKSGDNPFTFPGLTYSESTDNSKRLDHLKEPCVIIAGSGMCTGGRIKHHIRQYIDDPKNTILFVGYQVQGTLGYWIKEGRSKIKLLGVEARVRSKVESIDSFSGHADYKGLLNWLKYFTPSPKKVFITHGDEKSAVSLSDKIKKLGIDTYIPGMKDSIRL
jgi:metallo-beta-lactamase family protein